MKEGKHLKGTGIVRRVDSLGRVVIPMEVRKVLGMEVETPLAFYVDEEGNIVLKKYMKCCSLCGEKCTDAQLRAYRAALLCASCFSEIEKI